MKLKHKALLYNFLGFAIIFLIARFGLVYLLEVKPFYYAITSALIAMLLAPKFAVAQVNSSKKLMMKWIFLKDVKEL
ncbi:hypothetical protein PP182_14455 [Maribacter sp. PR1]|uniref:Polysaccharide biosynthesis protein n=1 Tax=Maribacter cobaltidurans TaxID=1178778 RepID=A0ABU7IWB7_9FLAO|nr:MULTISPECIES: hypothetical protein [Maribacter]MDC6389897.1 hypothetical protein [Maribacter sp. PR1]MEE1977287.1 hypothetical protein [Maribacter cobaltidurans]